MSLKKEERKRGSDLIHMPEYMLFKEYQSAVQSIVGITREQPLVIYPSPLFSSAAKSDYTRRHKKWRVHSLVEHRSTVHTSYPTLFFCSSRGIYELGDMPVYILVLLLRRYLLTRLLDHSILIISLKKYNKTSK